MHETGYNGFRYRGIALYNSSWLVQSLPCHFLEDSSLMKGKAVYKLTNFFNRQHPLTAFALICYEKTCSYGDRAPRSILARSFAVGWILIGVCICSIFTATLTTSLTTISLDTKKSLPGSKVGIYFTYCTI